MCAQHRKPSKAGWSPSCHAVPTNLSTWSESSGWGKVSGVMCRSPQPESSALLVAYLAM